MRYLTATLLLLLPASIALGAEPTFSGPKLEIESYKLPNGLKVALHRDASVPRVTVCVAYHVGSKNERAGRTGFAHFFEHMMFRGTKNVPNYDIPLQETGAQSNAFTSEDMTVYFETVSTEYLERALYLEAERLAFLPTALEQSKFDTEREVVKNERRQSVDNVPYGLVEETLLANVFPKGHPYSWSVIGSMKDLNAASLDDLRAFFAEFYHPANATLCLVGDFDPDSAKSLIARYFGPLVAGVRPAKVKAKEASVTSRELELADQVNLPRIHWTWESVAEDHPDAPALDLLALVLAGGETSRLYKALVRDLRLAKDVSADNDTKEIAGMFTLNSTAAEGQLTEAIARVFHDEISRVQAEPPSAAELSRMLARLETGFYGRLTRSVGRAIAISVGYAQHGDPEHFRKNFLRYFKVKPTDIQRVAQHYLKGAKVTLLVRPVKPGEAKSQSQPVGPDPSSAPGSNGALATRPPVPGPDWTKIPGPAEPASFRPPPYSRRKLSNGIDVWIATWKTLPLVQISMQSQVGTGDDPKDKPGLANLTARLLDQGTATKTATELAEAFEELGAGVRASAGADDMGVGASVLKRNLEPTLELVAEMLISPRFDPKDFDRERSQQLADLLQGPDSVSWIARRVFPILMFGPEHPYGKPAQGYPHSVKALTLDDVRAFHKTALGPKGATLIVAGDVDPDAVTAVLEKTLGRWRVNNSGPRPRPDSKKKEEPGTIFLVDKPGAVQSVIYVGRRWVDRRDPSYMPTLVGNHLLGADFLSRLNQNLREEHGYSYGAGSAFTFHRSKSVWRVATSVRTDATVPALKEIIKVLDALAGSNPITAEEISSAKSAEARMFPESFESPSGISGELAEIADHELPADYLEAFLANLEKTSPNDIQRSMTEVVAPAERIILVVGDRKTVEPEFRKAGMDRIKQVTIDGKQPNK